MNYNEQLKHPKWQKKRLEVLERDKFTCQLCKSTDKTLHVHHKYYLKNCKVWEYHNNAMTTLCKDCHKNTHDIALDMIKDISDLLKNKYQNELYLDMIYTMIDNLNHCEIYNLAIISIDRDKKLKLNEYIHDIYKKKK